MGGPRGRASVAPLLAEKIDVSPDGRTLVVSLAVFPDCPDLQCSKARLDRRAEGKPSGQVHDRLFVRHWDAWADGTRNHLFAVRLDQPGAAPVDLMRGLDADTPSRPFGDNGDYAIAPAGPEELPDGVVPCPNGTLRLLPGTLAEAGGMDGFFIARLTRLS